MVSGPSRRRKVDIVIRGWTADHGGRILGGSSRRRMAAISIRTGCRGEPTSLESATRFSGHFILSVSPGRRQGVASGRTRPTTGRRPREPPQAPSGRG